MCPTTWSRSARSTMPMPEFRAQGVRHLVMCGRAHRPSLTSLAPGAACSKLLARIGSAAFQGDDGLLKAMVRVLEEDGFTVLPAQAIVRDALPPAGLLTTRGPGCPGACRYPPWHRRGPGAWGRRCRPGRVVQQGLVLGVEAIEGTDALLARCGGLRREGAGRRTGEAGQARAGSPHRPADHRSRHHRARGRRRACRHRDRGGRDDRGRSCHNRRGCRPGGAFHPCLRPRPPSEETSP